MISSRFSPARMIGLLAVCGMLIVTVLSACSSSTATIEAPTPTPIPTPVPAVRPTFTVERGDIVNQLDFQARILSMVTKDLKFKTAGRVAKVSVAEGDTVKHGQLLAELQTSIDPYELKRAQLNLQKAQLSQQLFEAQTSKNAKGYALGQALKKVDVDLAQLELDQINQVVVQAQLVASMDGVVQTVNIAENGDVDASTIAVTLADPNQLEISASLSEAQMEPLAEDMPVSFTSGTGAGETFPGFIRSLPYPYGKSAQSTSASDDRSVRITLLGEWQKSGLGLGSPVKVSLIVASHQGVLWLPPQALRKFENTTFVIVQDAQGQHRANVTTGLSTGERVEITEGLSEGQIVVAP